MNNLLPPIDLTIKMSVPVLPPENVLAIVVPNEFLKKLGRWDLINLWHFRLLARLHMLPHVRRAGVSSHLFTLDIESTLEEVPDLKHLAKLVWETVDDTPYIPSMAEADALEYLHRMWTNPKMIRTIKKNDREFDRHKEILVSRYGALKTEDGEHYALSTMGKML